MTFNPCYLSDTTPVPQRFAPNLSNYDTSTPSSILNFKSLLNN